jgi:uncharacterized SAM-binding protein YcdF (DUF218 family)
MMYRIVEHLFQPYCLLLLLTGVALANLWRKRQESRRRLLLISVPFGLLVLSSMPAVSNLALRTLEQRYPPSRQRPADTEVIVVLLGGFKHPDAGRPEAELEWDSLYRCIHAAELYRQGPPCLVLVSGAKADPRDPGPSGPEVMRDFLVRIGVRVSDVIVEPSSQTTYQSAIACRHLLEERGLREVVLVTEAVHMYRSLRCFRKQGIEAVPSSCHHEVTEFEWRAQDFLPKPWAALNTLRVAHEWLGVVWYSLQGRI